MLTIYQIPNKINDKFYEEFSEELLSYRCAVYGLSLSDKDHEELSSMLDDMGQTKQTFYESYTKTALRERRIPFIISAPADPFYSETNMNRLRHSFRQAEEGKIITKTMEDLEAMAGE